MLFNSLNFLIFLPIVFICYWFLTKNNLKLQNILLLISSCFFYACWDWKFMFLLLFSIFLDFYTGIKIYESIKLTKKKIWLWISIGINLGFLCVFKYYNFFTESFSEALSLLGVKVDLGTIQLILPVGISFYTFHGLSYVIDLYKDRIKPERNIVNYSLFVSFFPLLVAGPIERATHLLPQINKKRKFDYSKAVDGLRQILWGLFKKIVIADNCAEYANLIFNNSNAYSGSTLVLGALFFTIQIYGDFSGYTDIALGTASLFGIELLQNFSFPYFSRNIAEFWRRWHISLSSWFKDYLYIPLGGSKGGIWVKIRNTFIIFIVSGIWHGANWTFIAWGFLNALYIMPSIIFNKNRIYLEIVAKGKYLPTIKEFLSIIFTFSLTTLAWIFFRANNVTHAINYITDIFTSSLFSVPYIIEVDTGSHIFPTFLIMMILLFIFIEWAGREGQYAIMHITKIGNRLSRNIFYLILILLIFYQGNFNTNTFIYFQF